MKNPKAIWDFFKSGFSVDAFKKSFMKNMQALDFSSILQTNLVPAGVLASSSNLIKQRMGLTETMPGANNVTQNVTNNVQVMDKNEFQRMLDENNRKMMEQMRTMSRG